MTKQGQAAVVLRKLPEWLNQLPVHWNIVPLARLGRSAGGGTPSKDVPAYWNGTIPWVSPKDMKSELIDDTEDHLSEAGVAASAATTVAVGNVLMVMRSGILKHTLPVATNRVICALNQDMRSFDLRPRVHPLYFLRFLQGLNSALLATLVKQGATVESVDSELLRLVDIPVPPPPEQRLILEFLDRETARIDALIEKKTRFIELLREKRQAVISTGVTQSACRTVATKDSGIEWLGRIPAHWAVTSLKYVWSVTDCKHLTAEFVDDGIPLVSIREAQGKYIDLTNAKSTTEWFYEQLVEGGRLPVEGDLIFTRNATVGEVAQVPIRAPRFAMGQDVCLLRKRDPAYSSDFMQLVLRSSVASDQLALIMVGATFKRVNVEEIRNLIIAWPPVHEQEMIAFRVGQALERVDALIRSSTSSIDLLRERRAALITAAVTGQINVRAEVPAEEPEPA